KLAVVSVALSLIMLLSACGGGDSPAEETQALAEITTSMTVDAEAETTVEATLIELETEQTIAVETESVPVDLDELVVVDNEACSIKITGIDPDNMWGYTLKVLLENKT